jgi:DNA-binding transcriptional ArsR family regulator
MSSAKPSLFSADQLAAVARLFAVLSEPSRLAILQALRAGPLTVGELVSATGLKQANVSRHLAVLHDQRLVGRERQGASVAYDIAEPMIFSLCHLVCGKMEKDARRAAALFRRDS